MVLTAFNRDNQMMMRRKKVRSQLSLQASRDAHSPAAGGRPVRTDLRQAAAAAAAHVVGTNGFALRPSGRCAASLSSNTCRVLTFCA
jgi:hypothetical protein